MAPVVSNRAGEAKFVTPWDIRAARRAFGAAMLGLVVVWLVTAASDEGQLTVGARAGRTMPLAPLCSAVGAALALGTERVRQESRAFEALGRAPGETGRLAALGAALPSLAVAFAIAAVPRVDVDAFYPRAAVGDQFVAQQDGTFVSRTLGVLVDADGETHALEEPLPASDADLPRGARMSAAAATGLAGVALALVASRAALRRSMLEPRARRRMRAFAIGESLACALLTLVAFQAAAARVVPAGIAVVPPAALLALTLVRQRLDRDGFILRSDRRRTS